MWVPRSGTTPSFYGSPAGILRGLNAATVPMPTPALPVRGPSSISWLMLGLGTLGFAAAWISLSLWNGAANSWMAVVGALDVALLVRLGRWPAGLPRAGLGLLAHLLVVALAAWGSIAGHLGRMFGLSPWQSALRLGADHAWTLSGLAFTPTDVAWIAAGLVLALIASR